MFKRTNFRKDPTKTTDSRAEKYSARDGAGCWELDGLPPAVLRDLLDTAISDSTDFEKVNAILKREEVDRAQLEELVRRAA